jgi:DNA-directed RNA polymerase specialized sigma24 family protein
MENDALAQQYGTPDQITSAFGALSTADLVRIKQIAILRSAGLAYETWEDLLNETITRTLEGSRRWPLHVPFIAFLAQTMRSIASEEWRRLESVQFIREAEFEGKGPEQESALVNLALTEITPEREAIAAQTLRMIDALFEDDMEATAVLHGLANGSTPEEIQDAIKISPTIFSSAQRRIRRTFARRFPQEGK